MAWRFSCTISVPSSSIVTASPSTRTCGFRERIARRPARVSPSRNVLANDAGSERITKLSSNSGSPVCTRLPVSRAATDRPKLTGATASRPPRLRSWMPLHPGALKFDDPLIGRLITIEAAQQERLLSFTTES